MRLLFLTLLIAYQCTCAYSQQPKEISKQYLSETKFPFVLVDSFETSMGTMVVDPANIESITVLKGESATSVYGEKATDGAIIINTKNGVNLFRIEELYKRHNLDETVQNYPVSIDHQPVANKKLILIDESYVKAVDPLLNSTGKNTINISTKKETRSQ